MEDLYLVMSAVIVLFLSYSLFRVVMMNRYIKKIEQELAKARSFNEEITGEIRKIADEPIRPELIDDLTGLPDRKVYQDRLQQAINQSSRQNSLFAVMSVDVDNFKEIDKVGPNIGDKVLKELASRLQMSVRQVDTVTRYAGGCFYFLLPHLSRAETAIYVAQRVQDNLLHSFKIDGYELALTVSIGIAVYPLDGVDSNTLIENAAHAMRQAKSKGKNQYQFCQSDLQHLGQQELKLIHLIRSPELLSKLHIQYKPYFNADSNIVQYISAVPNLRDVQFGMVPFTTFVSIAENSGKILEIHQWLLRSALEKCKSYAVHGLKPEFLSIPISLKQLENPH